MRKNFYIPYDVIYANTDAELDFPGYNNPRKLLLLLRQFREIYGRHKNKLEIRIYIPARLFAPCYWRLSVRRIGDLFTPALY